MKALDDPEGRRRLAQVVVWGTKPRGLLSRDAIEKRLIHVLERISKKLEDSKAVPPELEKQD